MIGPRLTMRPITDSERQIWPHATHVVIPVIEMPWMLDPPSPYAPRWEREQYARRLVRFWRGEDVGVAR